METDILVAGAGVAGLAAAAVFAARGFSVVCADPAPAPAGGDDLRSTAFLEPSVRLLEAAGVWERLAPHAAELRVMRLADAGGPDGTIRERADFTAAEIGAPRFGYNLPNAVLRREMTEHLLTSARVRLMLGTPVARVTARSSAALVALAPGAQVRAQVRAQVVVAADGRESFVREALGIGVRRWSYGQKALVFAVTHPVPHAGVSTEIHRSGGPFTLVPLPDIDDRHRSAVVWMEAGPRAQALFELDGPDFTAALNERAQGALGPLSLAGPRRLWPIVAQVAHRLDGPRTALVAEAAHVMPPIGAQGLNTSLRDVAVLRDLFTDARRAQEDIGAAPLLSRYHRLRHREILLRMAGIDALNRAAMTDVQALRNLRRAGLRALAGLSPARRAAMRLGLGTGPS